MLDVLSVTDMHRYQCIRGFVGSWVREACVTKVGVQCCVSLRTIHIDTLYWVVQMCR